MICDHFSMCSRVYTRFIYIPVRNPLLSRSICPYLTSVKVQDLDRSPVCFTINVFLCYSCLCSHWAVVDIQSGTERGVIWYHDIVATQPVLQFSECLCLLGSPE